MKNLAKEVKKIEVGSKPSRIAKGNMMVGIHIISTIDDPVIRCSVQSSMGEGRLSPAHSHRDGNKKTTAETVVLS